MKIKSVKMANYKRFSNLVIENIPETTKLVVMLGPNGCGKSSVFDFLLQHSTRLAGIQGNLDVDYHFRESKSSGGNFMTGGVEFYERSTSVYDVYVRSAHRNEPQLDLRTINIFLGGEKFLKMNQNNPELSKNLQKLIFSFRDIGGAKWMKTTRSEFFKNLQDAMKPLFGDLTLDNLENFAFSKGSIKGFALQNLSSGEMAAFDLLLDILVKRENYTDTVFCIDEPEAHISPRIQGRLLEALVKLLNEKSQMWIATHAVGVMRKAMELYKLNPKEVIFLDFGDLDFDTHQKITPAKPDRKFWDKIHRIALDDISELVTPDQIILCESEIGFDADCYNQIFGDNFPDTKFISAGGKKELKLYVPVVKAVAKGAKCLRLRDRDGSTSAKIDQLQNEGIKVLRRGSIEDYLLSDDMLEILCASLRADSGNVPTDGEAQLIRIRNSFPNGKAAAASIRQAIVRWGVQNIGDDRDDFLRNTMAPSVKPETQTYKELREIIFGNSQ